MKEYSKFSKTVQNKKQFVTDYAYKEGVFKTKQGKFIARVRKGNNKTPTTISQHETEEEANSAYNAFYDNQKNPLN